MRFHSSAVAGQYGHCPFVVLRTSACVVGKPFVSAISGVACPPCPPRCPPRCPLDHVAVDEPNVQAHGDQAACMRPRWLVCCSACALTHFRPSAGRYSLREPSHIAKGGPKPFMLS